MEEFLLSLIFGLLATPVMNFFNMKNGVEGILYYEEVHTQFFNKLIHCLFIPITLYGILMWFPLLWVSSKYMANKLRNMMFIFYISHYMTFNIHRSILVIFYAYPSLYYSRKFNCFYKGSYRYQTITAGLIVMFMALGTQEYFGHYLGGDAPSRFEAIPNAIIYAPYFGINGLF